MPSNYSTIGVHVDSEAAFADLARRIVAEGEGFAGRGGSYARSHPSRAQLWAQVSAAGELVGLAPHFEGEGVLRLRLTDRLVRDTDSEMDGSFHGWVVEDGVELLPVLFDCPDAGVHDDLPLPVDCDVQLAAFAHELELFPDDAAYAASQAGEPKFAAESWISTGLFEADLEQGPPSTALFSGHVLACASLEGPDSSFLWLLVQSVPGAIDVVCDPVVLDGSPQVGAVVSGHFWLSGRVLRVASDS